MSDPKLAFVINRVWRCSVADLERGGWGQAEQGTKPPSPGHIQKKNDGEDSLSKFCFIDPIPRPISGTATTFRSEWHFELPRKVLLPTGQLFQSNCFQYKRGTFFKSVSPFGIHQLVACMSTPCRLYTCHANMWRRFIYTHHTIQEHVTQWPWPQ